MEPHVNIAVVHYSLNLLDTAKLPSLMAKSALDLSTCVLLSVPRRVDLHLVQPAKVETVV